MSNNDEFMSLKDIPQEFLKNHNRYVEKMSNYAYVYPENGNNSNAVDNKEAFLMAMLLALVFDMA